MRSLGVAAAERSRLDRSGATRRRVARSRVLGIAIWGLLCCELPTPLAQAAAIKLFDAVPVTRAGDVMDPSKSASFGQTQLVLICPPAPAAIIASDPSGVGPIVVDNFLTVDGDNVCPIGTDAGYRNCFQSFRGGSSEASLAYIGVPALDVSSHISSGSHVVTFSLDDHGGLLGSSEIWLVTNCYLWTQR